MCLFLTEHYPALMGEGMEMGLRAYLIRMAGCNMRCSYCDTTYSFTEGEPYDVDDLVDTVLGTGHSNVFFTGGEPLLQAKALHRLLDLLTARGVRCMLQTNGSIFERDVVRHLSLLSVDVKGPSSGEVPAQHIPDFLSYASSCGIQTQAKFLLQTDEDYDFAKRCAGRLAPFTTRIVLGVVNAGVGAIEALSTQRVWAERFLADPGWPPQTAFLPQYHALLWEPRERGR